VITRIVRCICETVSRYTASAARQRTETDKMLWLVVRQLSRASRT